MTVDDLLPVALERLGMRTAEAMMGGRVSREALRTAHRALKADRQAFPGDWDAWAFFLSVLPCVRVAWEARMRAQLDEQRLRALSTEGRACCRRMRAIAHRAGGRLLEEFRTEPPPSPLRVGRRNETELRDMLIGHVRSSYPVKHAPGGAWRAATAIAALLWPGVAHSAELKRDTRRRQKRHDRLSSRAAIYYAEAVRQGALARVLEEAAAGLTGEAAA